jgi:hypothetical protein
LLPDRFDHQTPLQGPRRSGRARRPGRGADPTSGGRQSGLEQARGTPSDA